MSSYFSFAFILCLSALSLGCSEEDSGSDERLTLSFQGQNRFVYVHVPEGYSGQEPVPLVIALHGAGDTGGNFQQGAGLDKEADKYGFMVAYPSASTNNWAEGCNCNRPDIDGVDDVGFTDAVVALLSEKYSINANRRFVIGFSQGGLFAQRLACERSQKYQAFATVAAMISEPLSRTCMPSTRVSMLMINGTADAVLPFYGIPSGSFATKSVFETLAMWKEKNQCTGSIETEIFRASSPLTQHHRVEGCPGTTEVGLYEIFDGGHQWPRGKIDAPSLITGFFGLNQ